MRNLALCAALAVLSGIALLALPVRAADHDKWIEVRSPNFIVVSNGSEGEARKVALQFEQIRQLFRDSLSYTRNHPISGHHHSGSQGRKYPPPVTARILGRKGALPSGGNLR